MVFFDGQYFLNLLVGLQHLVNSGFLRKALVQELEGEVEELTNALETRRYGGMGLGCVCVCVCESNSVPKRSKI